METRRLMSHLGLAALATAGLGLSVACSDSADADQVLGASALSAQADADLTGSWQINHEESEHPREGFRRRPGGPGDGEPDGERPEFRRRDRFGPDEGPGPGPRRPGPMLVGPALEITQSEATVEIAGPRGRSITLYTDGRTITRDLERGRVEIRAGWEGDALVVERVMEDRLTVTLRFELSTDRSQLDLTTRIEGERLPEPIEFRRVYDRV